MVDDGSDPPLARPARTPLEVKVVHQERRGFGLACARNTGVVAAAHDILVFLDGDLTSRHGDLFRAGVPGRNSESCGHCTCPF